MPGLTEALTRDTAFSSYFFRVAEIGRLRWRLIQYRERGFRNYDVAFAELIRAVAGQALVFECDPEEIASAPDQATLAAQIVEGQFKSDGQTSLVNPCPAVGDVREVDVTRVLRKRFGNPGHRDFLPGREVRASRARTATAKQSVLTPPPMLARFLRYHGS